MKTWLLHLWERARSSLWFVPTWMSLVAVALAVAAARADRAPSTAAGARWADWLGPGSAEGARTLLATVAGSMMTPTQEKRRAAVRAQADMVLHAALGGPFQECDRRDLEARHRQVLQVLEAGPA